MTAFAAPSRPYPLRTTPVTPPPATATVEISLAAWTRDLKQSSPREIHALLSRPGLLSFALGGSRRSCFPCGRTLAPRSTYCAPSPTR